jgi:hypothetical protein
MHKGQLVFTQLCSFLPEKVPIKELFKEENIYRNYQILTCQDLTNNSFFLSSNLFPSKKPTDQGMNRNWNPPVTQIYQDKNVNLLRNNEILLCLERKSMS